MNWSTFEKDMEKLARKMKAERVRAVRVEIENWNEKNFAYRVRVKFAARQPDLGVRVK